MKLEDTLEQLEEVLMMADIGGTTTDEIISDLRSIAKEDSLDPDDIKSVLRGRLVSTLEGRGGQGAFGSLEEEAASAAASAADAEAAEAAGVAAAAYNPRAIRFAGPEEDPQLTVLMVIGANGMGKTTTIGKLANRLREEGQQKVMLAACDTFRAAAVDQLEMWADRAQVGFLGPEAPDSAGESAAASGDEKPATVLYRALDVAIKDEVDVLIVDTSGRLSNNVQLNEELKKMKRVVEKRLGRPPHEVLLVVDASIGRNAVDQARVWKDDVGVSGVVVTKLDGTARAGYVVAMTRDLGLPVKLIGVGEKIDDLRDFEPGPFVDALLGNDEAKAAALQERLDANLLEARSRAAEAERKRKEEVAAKQAAKDAKRNNGGGGGGLFGNFGGGGGGGGMEAPPSTAAEPLELVMMGDNESEASSSGFSSSSSSSSTRAKKKSSGAAKKNKKKKKKKN
jgi:fused signal recognition particle receptor